MPTPTVTRRIAQSTGIVMASVLASRVLGFLRDWTVAREVGSSAVTDAYYAAFTLPDFLNYLVAAGSLSLTFIPVFAQYSAENREEEGWHVFSTVITFMTVAMLALVGLGEIFAPQIAQVIAPGFRSEEKARLIFLTRLMLPAQIFFYLGGILSAVQYAKARFLVPSMAPVVYNLGIILGGVLLSRPYGITGFSVGVLAGAFAGNFLLQVFGAARVGARFSPGLDLKHPGFLLFVKLSIPIMLALGLPFTDDWIIRWFGSYLQAASITWLNFSKTLMRVPLGLVGQAVGVASFPFLAQLYSERKFEELHHALNSAVKSVIALLLPISALTIAESRFVVHFVFSHTRLTEADLEATAAALVFFSLGMFAWGAQNILARGFYAVRDTLTPAVVSTALTLLSLPLYWLLVRKVQYLGLALASSTGIIAYTLLLFLLLNRRLRSPGSSGLLVFFLKLVLASAISAFACWKLAAWLETRLAWRTTLGAFEVLVTASSVGVVLTVVAAKLLRLRELDDWLKKISLFSQT